jgi:hypothetical protein
VLEDDGTIFEITIDKGTSVATARLCPSDEPWSFEYRTIFSETFRRSPRSYFNVKE